MCVFLISPVPIAEPLTSKLIDTPVFHNLAPRPIKYRVSVSIPNADWEYLKPNKKTKLWTLHTILFGKIKLIIQIQLNWKNRIKSTYIF